VKNSVFWDTYVTFQFGGMVGTTERNLWPPTFRILHSEKNVKIRR